MEDGAGSPATTDDAQQRQVILQRARLGEERLMAQACRVSFWAFLRYAYGVNQHPYLRTWLIPRVHKPLCDWLQKHAEDWMERRRTRAYKEQKRLIVIMPRNTGKTTIVTRAFTLWLHLRDSELSTFIGSETIERAEQFIGPMRPILEGTDAYARFTQFYGNYFDAKRWNNASMTHTARKGLSRQDPSIGIWAVKTGITGSHPDVLIFDDPISYEKMGQIREWLNIVNDHFDSLTPVLNADGMMLLVGTRYHDGDLIGTSIKRGGVRSWAGMKPPGVLTRKDGTWDMWFMSVRDTKGNPTFPEIWSDHRLKVWERDKNAYYWAQGMNDPQSSELNPLSRAQIERLWVDAKEVPANVRISIHVDTAFFVPTRTIRGDETVIQVWAHARDGSGEVYFLEGLSSRTWKATEYLTQLVQLVRKLQLRGHRILGITDEQETGGKVGSWETMVHNAFTEANVRQPRLVTLKRGPTQKTQRLLEAAAYWVEGYVRLVRGAPGVDSLVDQMSRIGTSDHDDWSDAASDVFCKDLYLPRRSSSADKQPEDPRYPGDSVLRPAGDFNATTEYDRYFHRSKDELRPPI